MSISSVSLSFVEGALGIPAEQTDGVIVVFGYCTAGVAGTLYSFDQASPSKAVSVLGQGKLAQFVASVLATPNHGPVYAMPCAATAGVLSAVTPAGTSPPTVTLTGNSLDDYIAIVKCVTAGARGTFTFKYSLDGGTNYSVELTSAATYAIPNSGITLNFANTAASADNVWTFTGAAPTHSNTQVTDGIAAVIAAGTDFGWGVVLAAPPGVDDAARATAMASQFAAVSAKADTLETAFKYVGFSLEGPSPVATDAAGLATWKTALAAAAPALSHKRMQVCAGYCTMASDVDGRSYRRSSVFPIAGRLSAVSISSALGEVRAGALRALSAIEWDEATMGGLDALRFATLRTWAGRAGFFVEGLGKLFEAPGGDYESVPFLRVINRAAKTGRNALLNYVSTRIPASTSTGLISAGAAAAIDIDLTSQLAATLMNGTEQHASAVQARVSRTDDIRPPSGVLTGEFAVVPLLYPKAITFSIGFSRSLASAA